MNNPNAKDQLGTTVQSYAAKFAAGTGQAAAAPGSLQPADPSVFGTRTPQQQKTILTAIQLSRSPNPATAQLGQTILSKFLTQDLQSEWVPTTLESGDSKQSVLRNTRTGELKSIDPGMFNFAPNNKVANTLRDERNAQINIKNLNSTIGIYNGILKSASRNDTAGDIALTYGIAKIMDPQSAVREGEYATIAGSQAIPDIIKGYAQYLAGGNKLTPESRQRLLNIARDRMIAYRDAAGPENERYAGLAKAFRLDPSLVTADLPSVADVPTLVKPTPRAPGKGNPLPTVGTRIPDVSGLQGLPDGTIVRGDDGRRYAIRGGQPVPLPDQQSAGVQ
jgi:hypothetical protein